MHVFEPKPREELAQHIPSVAESFGIRGRFLGQLNATAQSDAPILPEPGPSVCRKGDLGIRIGRIVGSRAPVPKPCKPKPPDFAGFLKGEIIKGVLPILGFACKDIFIVCKIHAVEHARTGERKSSTEKPSSNKGLDSLHSAPMTRMAISPEHRNPATRMASA